MTLRISYELDSALVFRRKTRIFGNIDNNIQPLTATEVVSHEMEEAFSPEKLDSLFWRDDTFFRAIEKK